MYKIITLYVFFTLISSCKEQEKEIVTFDDISNGGIKGEIKDSITHKKEALYYTLLSDVSQVVIDSILKEKIAVTSIESTLFPDRFGAIRTEKWLFKNELDSLLFYHWTFPDSIKTLNTFYNWMDCYGKNCKSIRIGEQVKFINNRNVLFLIQNKEFFYIESENSIDINEYTSLISKQLKEKRWNYVIYQAKRKKANWFKVNSTFKLIPL